ncbi:MAG: hypothetical protein AAFU53_15065 [Cyanobacteria bacterium J06632_3]
MAKKLFIGKQSIGKLSLSKTLALVCMSAGLIACQGQSSVGDADAGELEIDTDAAAQIFPSDFKDACQGAPVTGAAEYDEASAEIHPIYVFLREDEGGSFYERSGQLPEAWQKEWEQSAETELVACVTPEERTLSQKCEFEDEGEPTYTLETYDTTYLAEVRVAKTGKLLTSETLDLKADSDCPVFHMFTEGEQLDTEDADFGQAVLDLVKPFVQPEA